eukprot:403373125
MKSNNDPKTQEEIKQVSSSQKSKSIVTKEKDPSQQKPKPQQSQQNSQQIVLNTREVRYPVIKQIARKVFGWKISKCRNPDDDWDIFWTDDVFSADKLKGMKPYQMINHFPGMYLIALKHNLGKYLKAMQKALPEEFKFFPRTWITPYESFDMNNYIQTRKTPMTMIVKPQNQCQGKGIFITRKVDDIPKDKCHVVQQYQTNPYLIDGKKFDLRIYVLVTQVEPNLNCFIYGDGLARFATEEYNSAPINNSNLFMHLTNYAINKNSEKFEGNEADFKKRLIEIYEFFEQEGHDVGTLKSQINDIIIKTLMAIQPQLAHNYNSCTPAHSEFRSCFELLGFDILVDKKMKPWLLEVNHAPSFNDDTEVDKIVKTGLITDTFRLLDVKIANKQKILSKVNQTVAKRSTDNNQNEKQSDQVNRNQVLDLVDQQISQIQDGQGQQENGMKEDDFQKYEKFQLQNLGNYEKIYPLKLDSEENIAKNLVYESIREQAHKVWVTQTGVQKNANEEPKRKQPDSKDMKVIMKNRQAKSSQDNMPKPSRIQVKDGENKGFKNLKSSSSQQIGQQEFQDQSQTSTKMSISSSQSQRTQKNIDSQNPYQMYEQETSKHNNRPPLERGMSVKSQKSAIQFQPTEQKQNQSIAYSQPPQTKFKLDPNYIPQNFDQNNMDNNQEPKKYYIDTNKYDQLLPNINSKQTGSSYAWEPVKKHTGPKQAISNQVFEFKESTGVASGLSLGVGQQLPQKRDGMMQEIQNYQNGSNRNSNQGKSKSGQNNMKVHASQSRQQHHQQNLEIIRHNQYAYQMLDLQVGQSNQNLRDTNNDKIKETQQKPKFDRFKYKPQY